MFISFWLFFKFNVSLYWFLFIMASFSQVKKLFYCDLRHKLIETYYFVKKKKKMNHLMSYTSYLSWYLIFVILYMVSCAENNQNYSIQTTLKCLVDCKRKLVSFFHFILTCSSTKIQECGVDEKARNVPGYCFRSNSDGGSWRPDSQTQSLSKIPSCDSLSGGSSSGGKELGWWSKGFSFDWRTRPWAVASMETAR